MIDDYIAFSATEVGYNHVKSDKVCEDASGFYDDEQMHICVVADGHGSDNYPRTDRGSKMAVDSAIKRTIDFVKTTYSEDPTTSIGIEELLEDEKHGFPILLQLAKSILMDWHESVESDYRSAPFTDDELTKVSEKYKARYLAKNEEDRTVEKAYGCTLILFAVTSRYSFGLQIGDGKCVMIDKNGAFSEPIPWDENCQLNVTTSICDSDSIEEFRFFVTDKAPAAIFCGSDGIDDSYAASEELYALYRSILKIFIEHGLDVGRSEIVEYLPLLTKKGSGDDVSIGMILNTKETVALLPVFNIQADLFALYEKGKEKKQQLAANIEKDNALSMRIRNWLDSGHKSREGGTDDVYKLNDLRISREDLENEIKLIETQIRELEEKLDEKAEEVNVLESDVEQDEDGESEPDQDTEESVKDVSSNNMGQENEKQELQPIEDSDEGSISNEEEA